MHQQSTQPRRGVSRWLIISAVLASVCLLGIYGGTSLSSRQPTAQTKNFRKKRQRKSATPAQPVVEPTPQAEILQVSANITVDPHREAVLQYIEWLEKGYDRLKSAGHYTATFFKQERLGNDLTEGDVAEIKVRHSPFSVYMKWTEGEPGKELLFVEGANDGKMLVKQVGWKARLLPIVKVDPQCVLAMSQSRYPVTQMGLLALVETLIADRQRDLSSNPAFQCRMFENETCNDRPCVRFVLEYGSPEDSATYRKSDLFIDKEHGVPLEISNYTWPEKDWGDDWGCEEMDDATLIEYYSYCDLRLGVELADLDFDGTNEEYGFRQ